MNVTPTDFKEAQSGEKGWITTIRLVIAATHRPLRTSKSVIRKFGRSETVHWEIIFSEIREPQQVLFLIAKIWGSFKLSPKEVSSTTQKTQNIKTAEPGWF